MAYMSQEKKKSLAPAILACCKKHGVKATISVDHHSTLVLNIRSGSIDFIGNYNEVAKGTVDRFGQSRVAADTLNINHYHYERAFTGAALDFLKEVMPLLNDGNFDKSDIQSDYFHVGWYLDVNVGRWNRPYEYTPAVSLPLAA